MIKIDFTTKETVHEYVTNYLGDKFLYDENKELHSYNDLPAVVYFNREKHWYNHGKFLILELPDKIYKNNKGY